MQAMLRHAYLVLARDETIYVSEDGHFGLMWLETYGAILLEDSPTGVRETWYGRNSSQRSERATLKHAGP